MSIYLQTNESLEDYIPFKGYQVTGFSDHNELAYHKVFRTPEEAIESWFKVSKKYPMMVNISASSRSYAMELIEFAHDNPDVISNLHSKYNNPYKLNWLMSIIDRWYSNNCRSYLGPGDVVSPFAQG